ncbi:MAG TPA: LPXTG cell wall anchor domain-containing protein [Solirubrobacterales bacterium]
MRPDSYTFVIYLRYSAAHGGLIVNPTRYLLHVRRGGSIASAATGVGTGTDTGKRWWIAGGAALLLLAGGALLLRHRLAR